MSSEFQRTVTAEFSIGRFHFEVGDVIEFYGISNATPGQVLISTQGGVGLLASVVDVKSKTTGRRGAWPASYNYPTTKPL